MSVRKRVAILVGQAEEEYQRNFIEGYIKQAFTDDFDVCVFSMFRKYQDTAVREAGEANIFRLVNFSLFDGVVVLGDSIQTAGAEEWIEERLRESFMGPVLVIEKDSKYFSSVVTDGYTPILKLVSHLIEEHGFTDIAFLTGKRWHPHSKQRLLAYMDAMEKHGLTVRKQRIVYGDFWYTSGEMCVEQFMNSPSGMPQAIACANDCMAIGVCEALEKRGIKVPEDVAVVGFDSAEEGRFSPKPITSAAPPARKCGKYAADFIRQSLLDEEIPEFDAQAELVIGRSCGCECDERSYKTLLRDEWATEISEEGFYSINNSLSDDLLAQNSLLEYLSAVFEYSYQIKGAVEFHLCLQEPWKNMQMDETVSCSNKGYSTKMLHAINYRADGNGSMVSMDNMFDSHIMLPELDIESSTPRAWFFMPFFQEEESFGYTVVSYGNKVRTYDERYRRWVESIARGFECMRRSVKVQVAEKKRAAKFAELTGKDLNNLSEEDKADLDAVEQILDDNLLTYHFQPIVDATNGEIYSYEALMRSNTDRFVSPLTIIKYASMLNRLVDVEKATFVNVLSIIDDRRDFFTDKKVFINSIPGVQLKDEDLTHVEDLLAQNSDIAVVELTEEAELGDEALGKMKTRYQTLGIETAVDDYGTGYSNISNLLRYMPEYVKIDRSLLSEIQDKPQKQYFVREIIEFCHENDILALAEGVETSEELRTVIHFGVDLIQGYYTGRPLQELVAQIDPAVKEEIIKYANERKSGSIRRSYKAGRTNRVSLNNLTKDGYTDIVVGDGMPVYRDVTFVGTPGQTNNIRMHIATGFEGRLTLENIYFSGTGDKPCINLEPDVDLTLILSGESTLAGGGISVPESSKLTLEGDGSLDIVASDIPIYAAVRLQKNIFKNEGACRLTFNGEEVMI